VKITALNPAVASRMAERLPLESRPASLDGKTIYMVDINWGGSEAAYSVFEEMQGWFSRNMPGIKTVIKLKRGGYDADDPALWKEIAQHGHAAIIGVSARWLHIGRERREHEKIIQFLRWSRRCQHCRICYRL
jgi:hypothetical protein